MGKASIGSKSPSRIFMILTLFKSFSGSLSGYSCCAVASSGLGLKVLLVLGIEAFMLVCTIDWDVVSNVVAPTVIDWTGALLVVGIAISVVDVLVRSDALNTVEAVE